MPLIQKLFWKSNIG